MSPEHDRGDDVEVDGQELAPAAVDTSKVEEVVDQSAAYAGPRCSTRPMSERASSSSSLRSPSRSTYSGYYRSGYCSIVRRHGRELFELGVGALELLQPAVRECLWLRFLRLDGASSNASFPTATASCGELIQPPAQDEEARELRPRRRARRPTRHSRHRAPARPWIQRRRRLCHHDSATRSPATGADATEVLPYRPLGARGRGHVRGRPGNAAPGASPNDFGTMRSAPCWSSMTYTERPVVPWFRNVRRHDANAEGQRSRSTPKASRRLERRCPADQRFRPRGRRLKTRERRVAGKRLTDERGTAGKFLTTASGLGSRTPRPRPCPRGSPRSGGWDEVTTRSSPSGVGASFAAAARFDVPVVESSDEVSCELIVALDAEPLPGCAAATRTRSNIAEDQDDTEHDQRRDDQHERPWSLARSACRALGLRDARF